MRWLVTGIGLAISLAAGGLRADPLAICQAGNPQFPQLCPCAIDGAQAAGIDGAALDSLLANRWDGVPMDVAQRFGLIFVECAQAAVAGGATVQTPPPQAPVAAIPATPTPFPPVLPRFELAAPGQTSGTDAGRVPLAVPQMQVPDLTRAAPSAATPGAPTPIPGGPIPALASIPGGYRIVSDAQPGDWTLGGWIKGGNQFQVATVRNEAGVAMAFRCGSGPNPVLIVGPFPDGVPGQDVQITVRGAQGVIHQEANRALGFDRAYLAIGAMNQALIVALRSGNGVDLALSQTGLHRFGLTGSARVLDAARCAAGSPPGWLYAMAWDEVRHDPWQVGQAMHPNGIAPALFIPAVQGVAPDLVLTCDRRLASRSSLSVYDGRLRGQITLWRDGVETAQFPIETEVWGFRAQTDPLSDEIMTAMLAADRMSYLVDLDAPEGGFVGVETTLAGIAEGLPALICPGAPGTAAPDGTLDLTGSGIWTAAFNPDGADGPYDAAYAVFSVQGAPELFVWCGGLLNVLEHMTPPGRQGAEMRLRLSIDDDPARSVTEDFIYVRGGPAQLMGDNPALGRWLLEGQRLRLAVADAPGTSYVYPLDGLADAIRVFSHTCPG